MGDTISIGNKSDASIVKIHGSEKCEFKGKAVAISTDCNSKYILNNPIEGGKITVAEVEELVPVGELDPGQIHTPGIFVQRIFQGEKYEKRIEQRTTMIHSL